MRARVIKSSGVDKRRDACDGFTVVVMNKATYANTTRREYAASMRHGPQDSAPACPRGDRDGGGLRSTDASAADRPKHTERRGGTQFTPAFRSRSTQKFIAYAVQRARGKQLKLGAVTPSIRWRCETGNTLDPKDPRAKVSIPQVQGPLGRLGRREDMGQMARSVDYTESSGERKPPRHMQASSRLDGCKS